MTCAKLACRKDIRRESKPVEIVENRGLVFRPASFAVVVLNAKEDLRPRSASEVPDIVGVEDVSEVQVSRRPGRETRESRRGQDFAAFPARRSTACRLTGFVFRNVAHLSALD